MKAGEEVCVSILILDLVIQKNSDNLTNLLMQLMRLISMTPSLVKQMATWKNEASDRAAPKEEKTQQKWRSRQVSQIYRKELWAHLRVVNNLTQSKRALREGKLDRVPMHRVRKEQRRSAAREKRQLERDILPQIQKQNKLKMNLRESPARQIKTWQMLESGCKAHGYLMTWWGWVIRWAKQLLLRTQWWMIIPWGTTMTTAACRQI